MTPRRSGPRCARCIATLSMATRTPDRQDPPRSSRKSASACSRRDTTAPRRRIDQEPLNAVIGARCGGAPRGQGSIPRRTAATPARRAASWREMPRGLRVLRETDRRGSSSRGCGPARTAPLSSASQRGRGDAGIAPLPRRQSAALDGRGPPGAPRFRGCCRRPQVNRGAATCSRLRCRAAPHAGGVNAGTETEAIPADRNFAAAQSTARSHASVPDAVRRSDRSRPASRSSPAWSRRGSTREAGEVALGLRGRHRGSRDQRTGENNPSRGLHRPRRARRSSALMKSFSESPPTGCAPVNTIVISLL